jgi:hypothetical protein
MCIRDINKDSFDGEKVAKIDYAGFSFHFSLSLSTVQVKKYHLTTLAVYFLSEF